MSTCTCPRAFQALGRECAVTLERWQEAGLWLEWSEEGAWPLLLAPVVRTRPLVSRWAGRPCPQPVASTALIASYISETLPQPFKY